MENQSPLANNERYSGEDWKVTGPNCVTTTFDTLKEALLGVTKNPDLGSSLRSEAQGVLNRVSNVGTFLETPAGIKDQLMDMQTNEKN